jgi:electron transport complex protein RnfC
MTTFARGVHPSYNKGTTAASAIETAPLPKTVVIPLQQHAGAPCEPLVKKGDTVEEGQKIGDVSAFVSAPVHASIAGKVKEVEFHRHPSGARALAVVIEGDGIARDWGASAPFDADSLDPGAIRAALREAGIVGMGGAGFPTSVKLAPPNGKTIDTVILNGCECEPVLTADHRLMVEEADKVVKGLKALMRASGARKGMIGVEDNKPDAVEALRKAASAAGDISITVHETKYPQGAEKMLIKAALNRRVPPGKLPLDVGVVVNNVGTAYAVYEALYLKKPLIERVLTVSGGGVERPGNLRVRVGVSFEDVINLCGGMAGGEDVEVLNGGPMMGVAQATLAVPVVKGTSGITVLRGRSLKAASIEPCIRCASCVYACPMGLVPLRLGDYGRAFRTADFRAWDGLSCIECGCCSYVCPSKRPLVHWIRLGKLKVREEDAKAKAKGKP